ncbi:2-hydroxyacid dehydrogenase [Brevirhabdus sp.]|uniref:2-hydroxyacid dehydrogenase n=1 Tax=Brevirhabdus sp. TaxID=2004514 RepID=UPI0040583FDD
MPEVLITRRMPDKVVERARSLFDVTLRSEDAPVGAEEARALMERYDAILPTLGDAFGSETFQGLDQPRCKLLANFGVGYNHIDVSAATRAGVVVTNTPGAVTDATADLALTLILMTARRAGEGERMVRAGAWEGWHPVQMLGLHVSGKVLGIIGMGRIGKAIAKRCHAGLGMEVVFHNRSRVEDAGVPATQLSSAAEVARRADVVVVAVPGGPQTRHLIDAEVFAAMQPHAIFVNIARGDIVKEADLIAALQQGRIAGAGLDVYEFEPKVPQALIDMQNVTLLPHLGTAALETREGMGLMAVENLRAFFDGAEPPNRV